MFSALGNSILGGAGIVVKQVKKHTEPEMVNLSTLLASTMPCIIMCICEYLLESVLGGGGCLQGAGDLQEPGCLAPMM